MTRKFLKSFFLSLGIALCVLQVKRFCNKKTDGFELYKIHSSLPFNPDWECAPSTNEAEILKNLDQPFYYLAKGAQAYVFASADGQTVIKFFRIYHLLPPLWLRALSLPSVLQPYKICKMIQKRQELDKDFLSYKIAFDEMKEETGLLYLHLNKTTGLNQRLTIYDKIGIAHPLNLDEMEFLVQKRATLVFPSIDSLVKTEGEAAGKEAISTLVELLYTRCRKGIFDKDPDLNTNFGFLGRQAVQIDIGRFRKEQQIATAENDRDEIIRITDNFRQWLDQNHPSLSEHLLSEIHKTI